MHTIRQYHNDINHNSCQEIQKSSWNWIKSDRNGKRFLVLVWKRNLNKSETTANGQLEKQRRQNRTQGHNQHDKQGTNTNDEHDTNTKQTNKHQTNQHTQKHKNQKPNHKKTTTTKHEHTHTTKTQNNKTTTNRHKRTHAKLGRKPNLCSDSVAVACWLSACKVKQMVRLNSSGNRSDWCNMCIESYCLH